MENQATLFAEKYGIVDYEVKDGAMIYYRNYRYGNTRESFKHVVRFEGGNPNESIKALKRFTRKGDNN